ncbi:GNAT family N-acetyltransferase [Burkholderia glumae]|uniref:GNAT family N-acetyltransferase n=1 Tax=Burkholderia glumae TaxID=337 RepID=UPI000F5D7741|nr:GNAT family N-acetyltransferase [Burkholderia glumae]MCQ0031396.1 GNAT family N-acetyltransferase [Burkholderia glumae]MCQ0038630.1 GNAT family N-acetyltransferase [Burkholderia glumae]QJW81237.1 GNAT family N-acetyltransferase [Burkholderia glumae]RQZ70391.1 GNAT family N-acetyltransferase [Burkholderia glumae]UVS86285.1 GNAT family N-acetyltransferase [Burkholderia glumae]
MTLPTPDAALSHLDNAIWRALTTCQAGIALGGDLARRFEPAISPFGALAADTPQAWRALAALMAPGETVKMFGTTPWRPPGDFEIEGQGTLNQMMLRVPCEDGEHHADGGIERLSAGHAREIAELVALAQPGPFTPRTPEMGRYYGILQHGALVAMAGERLHLPGFTEISAVCVHPGHRGRRYAERLVRFAAKQIAARAEMPFLHVFAANTGAIALYGKLGFALRRPLQAVTLARR